MRARANGHRSPADSSRLFHQTLGRIAFVTPGLSAPQDFTANFAVPEGLRVGLIAPSPSLVNPTAIEVDAHRRSWVAEGVNSRE